MSKADSNSEREAQCPAGHPSGQKEFIAMMGFLISLIALSIDAMLPALSVIGADLGVTRANDVQLVIGSIFLGMSVGILFYGPAADSYGRKRCIYAGVIIFIIGSAISMLATNFTMMLVGRVMQGFGAAGPRVVTLAMVRDKYQGQTMARIMSLIMMVFIIVPTLAPALGQLILFILPWRAIFGSFMILGIACLVWFWQRQEETLHEEHRKEFSLKLIGLAVWEVSKHPVTRGYTLAAGLLFGSFVGYLVSSQQILQIQYDTGVYFPIYFGSLAFILGLSSYFNSRLLLIWRIEKVVFYSLNLFCVTEIIFYFYTATYAGHPPLWTLMIYLGLIFFCNGALFANLTTLAIHPMGHIAGIAISCITALQTGLCVLFGGMIGAFYDGTALPLVMSFMMTGIAAFVIVLLTNRQSQR